MTAFRGRARLVVAGVGLAMTIGAAVGSGGFDRQGAVAATDGAERPVVKVVDVTGSKVAACGEVDTAGPFVTGGCVVTAHDFTTDVSVRTPLGEMPFGTCSFTFDLHVAGDGEIWVERIGIGGASPCNDLQPCAPAKVLARQDSPTDRTPPAQVTPWRGQLEAGANGRPVAAIDMCFDSCLGRYRGPTRLTLTQDGGDQALAARKAGVGVTGLALTADYALTGAQLALR